MSQNPGREYPKMMYHTTKPSVTVYSRQQQTELGAEWSEKYIPQAYPKMKYGWNGKNATVKSAEEEAALGRGWGAKVDFTPYEGVQRKKSQQQDLLRWVDDWPVDGLSEDHRKKIKAHLMRADAEFWRSPEVPSSEADAMRRAFVGIAQVLLEIGLLTEELLRNQIPDLVWDSAIAGCWYRFASEQPHNIFPEHLGHYWVWRDESLNWNELFYPETTELLAALLEASVGKAKQRGKKQPRARWSNPALQRLKQTVRELHREGLTHQQICRRLGQQPRPPRAGWRNLDWPRAFLLHNSAVTKWLSDACS